MGSKCLVLGLGLLFASAAAAQTFSAGPLLAMSRAGVIVVPLDDAVVAIGGENIEGALRSAEILVDGSDHWSFFGRLRVPRVRHTVTPLADGEMLVAGGGGAHPQARLAELWNGDAFVSGGLMLAARNRHAATLLPDGRVLVTGGRDAHDRLIAEAELWDPRDHRWHPAGRLRHARCCHSATALPDGRVLVVAGLIAKPCDEPGERHCFASTSDVELWDPKTSRFSIGPSLPEHEDRAAHTATRLHDGRVLLAGGAEHDDPDRRRSDFLWTGGKWQPIDDKVFRAYHTATLLPDGKVLAVGGWRDMCGCCKRLPSRGQGASMDGPKLFDPATAKWSYAGGSEWFRARHGAAGRPDGSVVIVGGESTEWGLSNRIFSSVEIWTPTK